MATDVVMPQMGESIAEGTIVRWIKKVGDKVDRDEPLFEISTDKVDAEIPSPAAGVVSEIRVKEGETVPVNSVVAVIGHRRRCGGQGRWRGRAARDRAPSTAAAPKAVEPPKPSPQADGSPHPRRSTPVATAKPAAGPALAAPRRRVDEKPAPPPPPRPNPLRLRRGRPACRPRRRSAPALVAARAQDREGAQRRHLADSRHRHRRPRDEGRHPRLHRRTGAASGGSRQPGGSGRAGRTGGEAAHALRAPGEAARRAIASSRCR